MYKTLDEAAEELEKEIPEVYLQKCQWMQEFRSGGSTELYETIKINNSRFRECYILHNGLVEILKLRD